MTPLPLAALFTALAVSLTGSMLTIIAIPWFVLQTTGSPSRTGLAAFAGALALIVASLFGGSLVDRLGHRRISILGDLTSGTAIALVPALYATVGLAFWQLLILVFCANLFDAPGSTARAAMMPAVAEAAGVPLERVTSLAQAIQRGAQFVGAPLAGALITVLGTSRLLWIDAASFAVSALLVALAVPSSRAAGAPPAGTLPSAGYLADLRTGLRFIRQDRLTRAIVLTVMLTNFLDAPLPSVVLPVYARRVFGSPLDLGLMVAAFGGGSLLGALLFAAVGSRLPRRPTFVGAFVCVGLTFAVLTAFPPLTVALAALLLAGLAAGPVNPIITTLAYERIPPDMLGRVLGTLLAGAFLAIPLGVLLDGYLLQGIGVRLTLLALTLSYLAVTLGLATNPTFARMDTR